jgi:hypothetical protein
LITQAGLYSVNFYENKGFSFDYNVDETIDLSSISNTGETYTFETDSNYNQYSNQIKTAFNNDIKNDHTIQLWINGLTKENLDDLERIRLSIYGFIPVLEFMDKQLYLINEPFYLNTPNSFESQASHTFNIQIKPKILTLQKLQKVT